MTAVVSGQYMNGIMETLSRFPFGMDSYEDTVLLTDDTFLAIFRNFRLFSLENKSKLDDSLKGWIKTKMLEAIIQDLKAKTSLLQPDYLPDPFRRAVEQHHTAIIKIELQGEAFFFLSCFVYKGQICLGTLADEFFRHQRL